MLMDLSFNQITVGWIEERVFSHLRKVELNRQEANTAMSKISGNITMLKTIETAYQLTVACKNTKSLSGNLKFLSFLYEMRLPCEPSPTKLTSLTGISP